MPKRSRTTGGWAEEKVRKPHPNRYKFTKEDCRKGYDAAMTAALKHSWERYAWLYYRIRGFYRAKRREATE